jgi:membrane protein
MLTVHQYWRLLQRAANAWVDDNAASMGAAVAFYSAFALAPVLLIVSAVAGLVFGATRARAEMLAQVGDLIGPVGSVAVRHLLDATSQASTGIAATVIGVALLLIGASSVMLELQHDLDVIWHCHPRRTGFWAMMWDRVAALLLILAAGSLLLLSLLVGTVLNALVYASPLFGRHALALHTLHLVLTLIVFSLLFAMLFKWLPNVRLGWREVWRGAFLTALLFTVGQLGIGYYLGHSSTTSAYAAVASLLVLLLWLYYGAQIFLFGAELVHASARHPSLPASHRRYRPHGSQAAHGANAAPATPGAHAARRAHPAHPVHPASP